VTAAGLIHLADAEVVERDIRQYRHSVAEEEDIPW